MGRPNVGKSSLLNRMLGQKLAITSHKAQTTRHRILGVHTTDNGQIVFVDTPGIHDRGDKAMNRYLNRTAHTALLDVDVIVFLVQIGVWTEEDAAVLKLIKQSRINALLVINKIDTVTRREEILPFLAQITEQTGFETAIPLSARTGDNCDLLEEQLLAMLPEGENIYPPDQLTDRPERFFAAELIREQLTRRYHNELPYAISIEIEKFEEKPHIYHIAAIIWVERENQKAIIVGKQGLKLKETAIAARHTLQQFFDKKVNLKVWVKVKKSWSSDVKSLSQLGYDG